MREHQALTKLEARVPRCACAAPQSPLHVPRPAERLRRLFNTQPAVPGPNSVRTAACDLLFTGVCSMAPGNTHLGTAAEQRGCASQNWPPSVPDSPAARLLCGCARQLLAEEQAMETGITQ